MCLVTNTCLYLVFNTKLHLRVNQGHTNKVNKLHHIVTPCEHCRYVAKVKMSSSDTLRYLAFHDNGLYTLVRTIPFP